MTDFDADELRAHAVCHEIAKAIPLLWDAYTAAAPMCTTCGGSGDILKPHPTNRHLLATDNCQCEHALHPGRQSFAEWCTRLIALDRACHQELAFLAEIRDRGSLGLSPDGRAQLAVIDRVLAARP